MGMIHMLLLMRAIRKNEAESARHLSYVERAFADQRARDGIYLNEAARQTAYRIASGRRRNA